MTAEGITRREQEVLVALATLPDATHAELGAGLGIAKKTVEVHIGHLCEKLDCRTTRGLLVKAIKMGLLPHEDHQHLWRNWRQCAQCGLTEATAA